MVLTEDGFCVFIGIDWADEAHSVSLCPAGGSRPEQAEILQEPQALEEWMTSLRQRFPEGNMAICLEQAKGPLIYHLMSYPFVVLFPANPKAVKSFRESFKHSGAKDDPPDADLMREMAQAHRDRMRAYRPDDPQTRMIQMLCEDRRKVINQRSALANRLTTTLKCYFPQALQLVGSQIYNEVTCSFLERWEDLESVQRAHKKTIRAFYKSHRVSEEKIEKRLELIRKARPLTTDLAITTASTMIIRVTIAQIRVLNEAIREYDQQIETLFADHPDADIFDSFPGAGKALAPRLLAAWGTDRSRHDTPESMQMLSGIAPVTVKSGKNYNTQQTSASGNQ
jgi:transposase